MGGEELEKNRIGTVMGRPREIAITTFGRHI
jgi:hypothetical protein